MLLHSISNKTLRIYTTNICIKCTSDTISNERSSDTKPRNEKINVSFCLN